MSRTPSSPKVLIAAGGTGGHIYPALAMADAFRRLCPGVKVEFVGTPHGLENKIIPPKGYKIHLLPVGRLNSNVPLWERLRTLTVLPWSFIKSARLLRRERPDFVLGVGGYVSGPVLLMASLLGFRSAIWEPNAMPGMANRILARFVDECWVVFEEARAFLKSRRLHTAGMPVRQEIEDVPALTAGAAPATTAPGAAPAPDRGGFHILVFGGSQGARGINNTVLAMVKEGGEGLRGCRIVHQTGAADFERIREGYAEIPRRAGSDGDLALPPVEVDVREYLHDMGNQYAQADLVICRAGTGTLSELAACGKAA
ncbi:MAG: glycosyltransferase, partial [Bdellovibrionales bacterium]